MNHIICFGIYRTDTNAPVRSMYLRIKTNDIELFTEDINESGMIDQELLRLFNRECRVLESTMANTISVESDTLKNLLSWTLSIERTGRMSETYDYEYNV